MSKVKKYGKSEEDLHAQKMFTCREIIKEILVFGVNEDQKKQIIKLLALELEDTNLMRDIISSVESEDKTSSKKLIYTD